MSSTDHSMNNKALVLGATGGIGSEVARQLRDAGWHVRALNRRQDDAIMHRDGITWLRGDAMNRGDVMQAAQGCAVIVHAVNPPGYRRWTELVLPMVDNTIAAAIAEQATILLPGTIYNYGPDAFPFLTEDAQQRPLTRKGAIRVELERRLQDATCQGARVLVVRAGDFFGPGAGNSWFSQGVVKPGRDVNIIHVPSASGIGHQWSYVPDVARTMLALLSCRAALPAFATFHTAGHWDEDGMQMAHAIRRVVEKHGGQPRLRAFPWWAVQLGSPFISTFRELLEMRYLWQHPVRMGNARLESLLVAEPHTPWDEAVEATLAGLGCLPGAISTATEDGYPRPGRSSRTRPYPVQ